MVDRRWIGDLGLAILLALPLLALARPLAPDHKPVMTAPAAVSIASADRLPGNGRIGLLG